MAYIVFATEPPAVLNRGWDYSFRYFPARFHFKQDAKMKAAEASRKGGVSVHVVSDKEIRYDFNTLKANYVVRCERDGKVFATLETQHPTKDYDKTGDRSITCPKCGRRYFHCNGGEYADGKVGVWHSDRPLTILHDPASWRKEEGSELRRTEDSQRHGPGRPGRRPPEAPTAQAGPAGDQLHDHQPRDTPQEPPVGVEPKIRGHAGRGGGRKRKQVPPGDAEPQRPADV